MNQSAKRAARLMDIRDLLLKRPCSAQELAKLYCVSLTTIYCDLIDLQLEPLCVPLVVEREKWRIVSL